MPPRPALTVQAQLEHGVAPTWAPQGDAPLLPVLAYDIDPAFRRGIRDLLSEHGSELRARPRLDPLSEGPECARELREQSHCGPAGGRTLSSGEPRRCFVSPRPTLPARAAHGAPSTSL